MTEREQHVRRRAARPCRRVLVRDRRARLDDVSRDPAGRRRARAERLLGSVADCGSDHQLVALERASAAGVDASRVTASRTTASSTATGSSSVASRLPVRASCCDSDRAVRSASKRRLRSSAPRAAPATCWASSRSSTENARSSAKNTSTSPPSPRTGIASSDANGRRRATLGRSGRRPRRASPRASARRSAASASARGKASARTSRAARARRRAARPAPTARAPPRSRRRAPRPPPARLRRSVSASESGSPSSDGDAVEAALHARLARPLRVALRVPQRQRGERRERLEQLDVRVGERPLAVTDPDAEHAARLTRPHHRRDERA